MLRVQRLNVCGSWHGHLPTAELRRVLKGLGQVRGVQGLRRDSEHFSPGYSNAARRHLADRLRVRI